MVSASANAQFQYPYLASLKAFYAPPITNLVQASDRNGNAPVQNAGNRQRPVPTFTFDNINLPDSLRDQVGSGYEWFMDGRPLGLSTQTIAAGSYTVKVKDPIGCWSDASNAFAHVVTGVEPALAALIRVRPNPTGGTVWVELTAPVSAPVRLTVYDALGKKLFEQDIAAGARKTAVDLSGQAGGLYLFKLRTSSGVIVRRVSKK